MTSSEDWRVVEPEDVVGTLERWVAAGATWKVLSETHGSVTLGLFTCDGGEEVSRLTSRSPEVLAYVEANRDA